MNFDLAELRSQTQPGWSPVNIGLMVVLFWIFWPLGLAMVAYIVWGNRLGLDFSKPGSFTGFGGRLMQALRAAIDGFNNQPVERSPSDFHTGTPAPEKESFDQWRQREQDRLASERGSLEREKKAFQEMKKEEHEQG